MPEFFALPRDLKRRLVSGAVNGYIGRRPIRGRASHGGGVRNLGDNLWSHGNPAFWYVLLVRFFERRNGSEEDEDFYVAL
jgi:hypothetical protein